MPLESSTSWGKPNGGYTLKTNWNGRPRSLWYSGGFAILLALLASSAPWINAQIATTTATLSGVVTDPAGAALPKATLTLTSSEKGITRNFTTDDGGRYSFNQLPPAAYSLTIKAKGFETYQQNGIALNAADTATQNVTLTIGAETTSVTVTADATLLNTDNANVASDIDAKQIVELPLNVRNVYGLATLNSSVSNTSEGQMLLGGGSGNSTDNADQDISFLNFNGGFFGSTAFLIDGTWDTDPEWGAVIFVPSVDATQQFKIQNNSFTAQYGWSTGNVVNVTTKSGTRNFHGSAYEFYANADTNALNYFANPAQCTQNGQNVCTLSRNQVGGSAGGPLYIPGIYRQRDKTFIYGLYEHFKVTTPSVSTYAVPDANFRAGNFSEVLGGPTGVTDALGRPVLLGQIYNPRSGRAITAGTVDPVTGLTATQTGYIRDPIPGNILANLSGYVPDPVGSKLLSYYPCPTCTGLGNNYVVSGASPAESNEYNIRVDQNFASNTTGYFRYSYKKEYKTGTADTWGTDPAGQGNTRPNNRWGMWAGLSHIFSPTFTMNIASGMNIFQESSVNQSFGFNPATELGLPAQVASQYPEFPIIIVPGQAQLGPIAGNQDGTTHHGPIGTVAVDLIKLHGKSTINFGFMGVERMDGEKTYNDTVLDFDGKFTTGPDPANGSGFSSGNGIASMLLGVVDGDSNGATTGTQAEQDYTISNRLLGGYVQDDWKPVHNLTFNLGLRYEVQTPYTVRGNQGFKFNPDVLNPISSMTGVPVQGALQPLEPGDRYVYAANFKNIAPRLGFSFQPISKAVVHGGYGIFYPDSVTCCSPVDTAGYVPATAINDSLNGGINPNPNISIANPWAGVYAQPTGSKNGEFQNIGNSVGATFTSRPSPYVQQWLLGVQYAITPSDSLEVNYIGNRGIHMISSNYNYDQLNPSYLSLGANALKASAAFNPYEAPLQTLEKGGTIAPSSCNLDNGGVQTAELLSPYPQYCIGGVAQVDAPVGQSFYNALQVTYNHRISHGLTAMISYTYSKFLDNVEGNNSWSYSGSSGPANNYNLAAEKSVDGGDIPHALVANYVYQLPIGRGKAVGSGLNRAANAVIGGWELSGIATFKGGIPISISGSDWTSYGGDPRPNVVASTKPSHPTTHEWFNTGAFQYAPYGDFGNAPRFFDNLRGPRYQDWDTALEKNWTFKESMRAQFRFETFNTFNHPSLYSPSGTGYSGCDPNSTSACNSNFGQITQAFAPRSIQWAGKFYW